jgi:predicted nucleotidyltransferase
MTASGKFIVRIDPKLHARYQTLARRRKISLNQLVAETLAQASPRAEKFALAVSQAYGASILGILIFGSEVRGEALASSDIDILVVLENSRKVERELYRIWDREVESKLGERYSPQFSHMPTDLRAAGGIWLEVALEGEVISDPKGVVRTTLSQLRQLISSGHYRRKIAHGHPYWVVEGKGAKVAE